MEAATVLNDAYASYAEARLWAVWLGTFTPKELALSMLISEELAERFCVALTFHGTCQVEAEFEGAEGTERIYGFVPLPPGPSEHPTEAPEWKATPGCYSEAPPRGYPVSGTALSNMQRRELARHRRPGR